MTRTTPWLFLTAAVAAAAACDSVAPTAAGPLPIEHAEPGLSLRLPRLSRGDTVEVMPGEPGDSLPGPGGLTPSTAGGGGGPARVDLTQDDVGAKIYNAVTVARIREGFGLATGFHAISGHGAKITTSLDVRYDGTSIGSDTAIQQKSWILSLDFYRSVTATARVFLEVACDIHLVAGSRHEAWIELLWGIDWFRGGEVVESSQADPVESGPCARTTGTGDLQTTDDATGMTCYYLITYDLETLEIVDAQLLSCDTSGGDGTQI